MVTHICHKQSLFYSVCIMDTRWRVGLFEGKSSHRVRMNCQFLVKKRKWIFLETMYFLKNQIMVVGLCLWKEEFIFGLDPVSVSNGSEEIHRQLTRCKNPCPLYHTPWQTRKRRPEKHLYFVNTLYFFILCLPWKPSMSRSKPSVLSNSNNGTSRCHSIFLPFCQQSSPCARVNVRRVPA
jgi:hypothetical protein